MARRHAVRVAEQIHSRPGDIDLAWVDQEASRLAAALLPLLDRSRTTVEGRLREADRRRKAWGTNARAFRANRRRLAAGDHAFEPIYFIWTMLNACNFRCRYCDDHTGHRYPELARDGQLDTEQGKRLLQIMRTGTAAVYFCGGEPTLRPDLPEQVRTAADLGYFPLMLNTNGSLLHKRLEHAEWGDLLTWLDVIVVSLDGVRSDTLADLYQTRHPEQVLVNLRLLSLLKEEIPFRLAVNSVVMPDNIDQVESILDICAAWDIWFAIVPVNVRSHAEASLISQPAYQQLAEKVLRRKRAGQKIIGSEAMLERLLWARDFICYPTLKPHIDHDGAMVWPCKASENVPPRRIDVLAHDDVRSLYEAACVACDPDYFCGQGSAQCGGLCSWMQNVTTDAYVRALRHPLGEGFLRAVLGFSAG